MSLLDNVSPAKALYDALGRLHSSAVQALGSAVASASPVEQAEWAHATDRVWTATSNAFVVSRILRLYPHTQPEESRGAWAARVRELTGRVSAFESDVRRASVTASTGAPTVQWIADRVSDLASDERERIERAEADHVDERTVLALVRRAFVVIDEATCKLTAEQIRTDERALLEALFFADDSLLSSPISAAWHRQAHQVSSESSVKELELERDVVPCVRRWFCGLFTSDVLWCQQQLDTPRPAEHPATALIQGVHALAYTGRLTHIGATSHNNYISGAQVDLLVRLETFWRMVAALVRALEGYLPTWSLAAQPEDIQVAAAAAVLTEIATFSQALPVHRRRAGQAHREPTKADRLKAVVEHLEGWWLNWWRSAHTSHSIQTLPQVLFQRVRLVRAGGVPTLMDCLLAIGAKVIEGARAGRFLARSLKSSGGIGAAEAHEVGALRDAFIAASQAWQMVVEGPEDQVGRLDITPAPRAVREGVLQMINLRRVNAAEVSPTHPHNFLVGWLRAEHLPDVTDAAHP